MRLEHWKEHWASRVGWMIFVGLCIAIVTGHYLFNPFIFGCAYYVSLFLARLSKVKAPTGAFLSTPEFVCVIALLYLYVAFHNELTRDQFEVQVQSTCRRSVYSDSEVATRLCDEIQSQIDDYLHQPLVPRRDDES